MNIQRRVLNKCLGKNNLTKMEGGFIQSGAASKKDINIINQIQKSRTVTHFEDIENCGGPSTFNLTGVADLVTCPYCLKIMKNKLGYKK